MGLESDLFAFGLRTRVDVARHPEVAERLLATRRLVAARFAGEKQETAVEFFDPERFSAYASIGENILFGHSSHSGLALEQLAQHPHFRAVIEEVELAGPLLQLGRRPGARHGRDLQGHLGRQRAVRALQPGDRR